MARADVLAAFARQLLTGKPAIPAIRDHAFVSWIDGHGCKGGFDEHGLSSKDRYDVFYAPPRCRWCGREPGEDAKLETYT